MPKSPRPQGNTEELRSSLLAVLKALEDTPQGGDLRQRVRAMIPAFEALGKVGAALIPAEMAPSGRDRIIAYLRKYPHQVVDGEELMVVSGIQEWPRRIRELRVQFGWWICSGITFKQIAAEDPDQAESIKREFNFDPSTVKPDQYVLMREEADEVAARRWKSINVIRREDIGVREKILKYLRKNVGITIGGEELAYLASNKTEWARRVRELRTEFGWPIATRQTGRPDLPVGAYVLERDVQAPEHDRKIPDSVRVEVLERDSFSCRECGWALSRAIKGDPRQCLELHHVHEHQHGGRNEAANLITLCNVHHVAVHRGDRLKNV